MSPAAVFQRDHHVHSRAHARHPPALPYLEHTRCTERMHTQVSLEAVLGGWLRGRDIALAKVDAQGLDVGVVSASDGV